ncbi:MAG: ABC transporter substrate-binding protein [Promethearchaeota archaeon]
MDTDFAVGTIGDFRDWDPALSIGDYGSLEYIVFNCLESLFWFQDKSSNPKPLLATSFQYEYWPEENNTRGFVNRGGIKAVDIVLRQNVKFHDGSDWNATVAKWNIDRIYTITGNLTGNGDIKNRDIFWKKASDFTQFFTLNWNLSWAIGQPGTYNGLSSSNSQLRGMFPLVNKTIIIENSDSGGIIRIEYNDWISYRPLELEIPMISMHTYKNFFDQGIYGWRYSDPPGTHLIGTGSYIFLEYNEFYDLRGSMEKNFYYWNRTAIENEGNFDIEYIYLYVFPSNQLGVMSRTTAMCTGDIDYGFDSPKQPFDDDIFFIPDVNYFNRGYSESPTTITLNCINETWMSWGAPFNYSSTIESMWGNKPDGLPRALRKAISFAIDYDNYISNILDERAVRSGGVLGIDSLYYNSSISLATYNITKAREVLLNSGSDGYTKTNFSYLCSVRGLNETSIDADWRFVADNNPLWVLNFYWDEHFSQLKDLVGMNIRDIGIAIQDPSETTNLISTSMWDVISHYGDGTFPIFSAHGWPLDWIYPNKYKEVGLQINYGDPNNGIWRTDPWTPVTDPAWDWFLGFNLAFCYDNDIDNWLDRAYFSNNTAKAKWLNKIVEKVQTELYPMVYLTQREEGVVLNDDWEMDFHGGSHFFANLNYLPRCFDCGIFTVPGYDIFILLGIVVFFLTLLQIGRKTRIIRKISII